MVRKFILFVQNILNTSQLLVGENYSRNTTWLHNRFHGHHIDKICNQRLKTGLNSFSILLVSSNFTFFMLSNERWNEVFPFEKIRLKDLFDRSHNPSHSTLYPDVLKLKTIIVVKQIQSSLGLRGFPLRGFWLHGFLRLHKKICITRFYSIKFQRYTNFAILWLA